MPTTTLGRKPLSAGTATQKPTLPILNTSATSATQPQTSVTATSITPENARSHLEIQGVLVKDARLTFDDITVALIGAANDTNLTDDALRTRIRALAYVGQQYTREFIAQQAADFLADQIQQAQKLGKENATRETEEVRQSFEKAKSALAEEISLFSKEKSSWLKAAEDIAALKETVAKLQGVFEEKSSETMRRIGEMKDEVEKATDEMRMDKHFEQGGAGPHAAQGISFWGPQGYTNTQEATHIHSYASMAASHLSPENQPSSGLQTQQHQSLERLKGSEEKKDRQLLLDAEDLGAQGNDKFSEKDLMIKIEAALKELTADQLYDTDNIIRCDKVTKLPRGGLLILMNSAKSKKFLAEPDVSERFAGLLGMTSKIIPRKYKVVIEKVPISTDLDDSELLKRIEQDNGITEGEIIGMKWIKNPARRSPEQRHAHIVAEFRTKFTANDFIAKPKLIDQAIVYSSKYNTDSFRCFKCQKEGHRSNVCPNKEDTCGTCAQKHRTDKCNNTGSPSCVTCGVEGHATWNRKACPKYFVSNNSQSLHVADRHYKYYVTHEEWTWAPASNVSIRPTPVRRSAPITEFIKQGRRHGNGSTRPRVASVSTSRSRAHTPRSTSRASGRDRPGSPAMRQSILDAYTNTSQSPVAPAYSPCLKSTSGPTPIDIPTLTLNNSDPAPVTQIGADSTTSAHV